jgi:hypothetical protein
VPARAPYSYSGSRRIREGRIMKDLEDLELKTEMDEIMRSVNSIMQKVESILPPEQEAHDSIEE